MTTPAVWRRLGLWRLTRNSVATGLYDRLMAAGLRLGRLDRFERSTADSDEASRDSTVVDELRMQRAAAGVPTALCGEPVAPDDRVLTALLDDRRVGHCVLSARPVYVPALARRLTLPGAYVWRVFVEPDVRGRGIGTTLVGAAVAAADEEFGAGTVSALIAPDNVPSRRAFRGRGFEPRERYTTVGVGGRTWQRGPSSPEPS